jgi:hypothetical protein
MYCPQCLTEYRDGFYECADCRVPLTPGLPPQLVPDSPNDGDLELVTVLETDDRYGLSLATAALEDAGIEYLVVGGTARFSAGIPRVFGSGQSGFYNCPCRIQVAAEFEAKARDLLEPFQEPLPRNKVEGETAPDREASD